MSGAFKRRRLGRSRKCPEVELWGGSDFSTCCFVLFLARLEEDTRFLWSLGTWERKKKDQHAQKRSEEKEKNLLKVGPLLQPLLKIRVDLFVIVGVHLVTLVDVKKGKKGIGEGFLLMSKVAKCRKGQRKTRQLSIFLVCISIFAPLIAHKKRSSIA